MRKILNIKFCVLLSIAMIVFTSCDDYLEREPLARYSEDNYPVGSGLSSYVFGMYSSLRDYNVHTFAFVVATNVRSEDADKGSTPSDGASTREFDDFTLTPSNGLVNGFYQGHFDGISQANNVLAQADSLRESVTEYDYNVARAEALFIRAYLYFNMVRAFGGVPLVTSNVTETVSIPRSTASQVYDQIEEDLLEAISFLPETWGHEYVGRVNKYVAEGILAKVYLYQQRWADALAMSQNVINSGRYDLNTSYDEIFTEEGENNSGSIFEVQALKNSDFQTNDFGCQYAVVQGVRGSGDWNLGWGFNVPSDQLDAAYENGDPRRDATILYAGETTPYGETVPDFDTGVPNPRYNQKVYTNPAYREATSGQGGWWVNVRILRYADVVLMAAEAANELGQTVESLEKLEMVRARARGELNVLPEVTTTDQAELRDAIRHERRIELAMEHERFYDIVRWGIASDVLHAAGKTNYTQGKHELLPIPQAQIDLSGNVLTQNPGY
ncbi:RagB/SusD family nutrient uptake outer membrane protein [Fulvivirga ligni]|uniref:RagB/SusD family nutrient uptake outer membrane protein n=1 Tax=Fulvivirga ligni TaxID=2904246 RepID=UPI001F373A63|nr:RagB/SusD family nutrient uptake outer membrane protein [Fulvivirga ligni]UII21990.1 RagB/SusD family nutrient uptake outer membrane protein [Fulvivirga ligni]